MKEVTILLKTEQDAVGLTGIVSKYPFDVDMVSGKYIIDAKSILGVLGMGIGRTVRLCMNTEDATVLIQELTPYLCEE